MSSSVVGPGQIIAQRYRIERLLGQGGMGAVYLAQQLSVGRNVALKLLGEGLPPGARPRARFEREALALGRLTHPNTVRLFDFGADDRCGPFIAMELLRGSDLAADLARHGPLRWDQALRLLQQVLGSLGEAHDAGIVHRDIKPANIFLCAGKEWPHVKVLDFGVAACTERASTRQLTATGAVLGSAAYMAPEQAQGHTAGAAADLYAVGVVLFEMLTATTPFEDRAFTAQLLAKVLEPAPRLRDAHPSLELPAELHALVGDLLERDLTRRPASARAVAARIEALLASASSAPGPARPLPIASEPASGSARTEAMLLPPTWDDGWAPQRSESGAGAGALARGSVRRPGARAAIGRSGAAALVATAAIATWLQHPQREAQPQPARDAEIAALLPPTVATAGSAQAARESGTADAPAREAQGLDALEAQGLDAREAQGLDALEAQGLDALELDARPDVPDGTRGAPAPAPQHAASHAAGEGAATPPERDTPPASASGTGAIPALASRASTTPDGMPRPAAPDPGSAPPAVPPLAPAITSGEPAHAPEAPPPGAGARAPDRLAPGAMRRPGSTPRYPTVAAARAAARAGELTPEQRNAVIAHLRERRLEARARAARAYRTGRITREQLRDRQRAIEREYEGH